jgi:molybdopterin converting factor small subunit
MIDVRFFGQLTDQTGCNTVSLEDPLDTDNLIRQLNERFPALAGAKYMLAVNNKMIQSNTILSPGCRIDLLPPFSGG